MIDEVLSINTTGFMTFVFDFADLEGANRDALVGRLKHPLLELFDRQKNADKAKKVLKTDFAKIVALYFSTYLNPQGFDHKGLGQKLDEKEQIFMRHLGKDKVRHLRLLISIARVVQEKPKRGLLGVA